jgi:membrane-associated protease RseP (regulator of RpoE activity)
VLLSFCLALLLHEFCHLTAAKAMGIPIETFHIGLGPRLYSFHWGCTCYEFAPLPVWGYVIAYTMRRTELEHYRAMWRAQRQKEPQPKAPRIRASEEQQAVWQLMSRPRQLVFLLGGVAVNFLVFFLTAWTVGWLAPEDNTGAANRVIDQFFKGDGSELAVLSSATTEGFWVLWIAFAVLNFLIGFGNLLPIPPLDGYRCLRVLVESVIRRDVPGWFARPVEILGYVIFALIIGIGAFLMLKDMVRIALE